MSVLYLRLLPWQNVNTKTGNAYVDLYCENTKTEGVIYDGKHCKQTMQFCRLQRIDFASIHPSA